MKIALCSAKNKIDDIDFNISQINSFLENTREQKPDILLFGESFLQSFDSLCFEYKKDIQKAVSVSNVNITKIRKLAKRSNTAIGFGFYENDHGSIYSSYIIIGKQGETVCKYQRISEGWRISNTCSDYREGKNFVTFKFENKTFAVLICGDLWEDHLLSKIIELKADAFLWPVFCSYSKSMWEKEKDDYRMRTEILDKPVMFINSLVEDSNQNKIGGGAFIWHLGKLIQELPIEQTGFILYEII